MVPTIATSRHKLCDKIVRVGVMTWPKTVETHYQAQIALTNKEYIKNGQNVVSDI